MRTLTVVSAANGVVLGMLGVAVPVIALSRMPPLWGRTVRRLRNR